MSRGVERFSAEVMKNARVALGISQRDVAFLTGLSQSTVRKAESGETHPEPHAFLKIAKALKIRPLELIKQESGPIRMPEIRACTGLALAEFANALEIETWRWSEIEHGMREPSEEQYAALASNFSFPEDFIRAAWRETRDRLMSRLAESGAIESAPNNS